ncbi:substrate-binding domain-containing protein [Chromobacterium haemolyticum]|uniref:substrate-binding domain-containing protein n=1 Tax=Chromobacterium TaxID=535 RepID=UPI00307D9752
MRNRLSMSGYKRLTIDDIAELAGVSRTTASMVLNGHAERYRISRATVERVEKVAREQHFNPSQSARSLRSRRSNSVGLVIPDLTNSAHAALAQAMEELCRQRDYQMLLVTSDEDPRREAEVMAHLAARQVDAMIVVPCTHEAKSYQKWVRRLPLVFVDRRVDGSGIPSVVTDGCASVERLVGDALEQGVSEVVFFGGQAELSPSRDRLQGYRQALTLHGVEEKPGWVCHRDYLRRSGFELMQQWRQQHHRLPQALFTASVSLLEGALAFLNQHCGLANAPLRLLTFDDHSLLDCLPLRVDAIVQDSREMAARSLELALALLEGQALAEPESLVPASLHRRWPA